MHIQRLFTGRGGYLIAATRETWSCSRPKLRSLSTTAIRKAAPLYVDAARLANDIHHTCQWGIGKRWGEYAFHVLLTGMIPIRILDQKCPCQTFESRIRSIEV